jgi:hypothetical protein
MSLTKITIAYLPGYGGNFLQTLFSLDSSTVPLWNIEDVNDTPVARVENFLTLCQNKKLIHFGDIELKQKSNNLVNYQFVVDSIHPGEFKFQPSSDQIFSVNLTWSDFSNYWLVESKKSFDYQIARLRVNETRKNLQIKKMFDTKSINLDQFLDRTQWKKEYERINLLLGLPSHTEAAEKLYSFWYNLRVKKFVDSFTNIPTENYATYCYQRLKEETYGAPTSWQLFYEKVRDPLWPDCDQEKDFFLLPDYIQKELINVFNYQPQKPV